MKTGKMEQNKNKCAIRTLSYSGKGLNEAGSRQFAWTRDLHL